MSFVTEIKSRSNPKVLWACGLSEKKKRDSEGLFRFEGIKLFLEAMREKLDIVAVFASEKAMETYASELCDFDGEIYKVADAVYEKLTEENAPQGVLTIAKKPLPGTVIRCADAFGAERVLLGDGCADAFGQKTVRAAMGSLFRVPTERAPLPEKIKELRAEGYKVYAAMLDKTSVRADEIEKGGKLAFVVGNEGHGISSEVRNRCDGSVIIPMRENGAESLNAAVAASVLMWEHKRI